MNIGKPGFSLTEIRKMLTDAGIDPNSAAGKIAIAYNFEPCAMVTEETRWSERIWVDTVHAIELDKSFVFGMAAEFRQVDGSLSVCEAVHKACQELNIKQRDAA